MSSDKQLQDLIDAASKKEVYGVNPLELFVKTYGFTKYDTNHRVYTKDMYIFYSCWYYAKYGSFPIKNYLVLKDYRTNVNNRRALKCSLVFKKNVEMFVKQSKLWQKNVPRLRQKIGLRRRKQLEKLISFRRLIKDFSQR